MQKRFEISGRGADARRSVNNGSSAHRSRAVYEILFTKNRPRFKRKRLQYEKARHAQP